MTNAKNHLSDVSSLPDASSLSASPGLASSPSLANSPSLALIDARMQKIAQHIAGRQSISKNIAKESDMSASFGERAADAVASFGGSWTFIGLFAAILLGWISINSLALFHVKTFDPYPFILLNLFLSMLAAVQAPIILMSQNRQANKDRLSAEHDYEVNLKAELEIMLLHEKVDCLRENQWSELISIQQKQIQLLESLLAAK